MIHLQVDNIQPPASTMVTDTAKRAKPGDDVLKHVVESGLCSSAAWSLNKNSLTDHKPPAKVVIHGGQTLATASSIMQNKSIKQLTLAGSMGFTLNRLNAVRTVVICSALTDYNDQEWFRTRGCKYPGPFSGNIRSFACTVKDCTYQDAQFSELIGLDLMTGVRSLTLRRCTGHIQQSFMRQLSTLESLEFNECSVIPADLSCLDRLSMLKICGDYTELPKLNSKLKILVVSSEELREVATLDKLTNLTGLSVKSSRVLDLPQLSTKLDFLAVICKNLREVPDLSSLIILKDLTLRCDLLEVLPDLSSLSKLERLRIECKTIQKLPELMTLINLSALRVNCSAVKVLPNLSTLINLSELSVHCTAVKTLPDLSNFDKLKKLSLHCGTVRFSGRTYAPGILHKVMFQ
jgi:Leucine-rich repeat (LRR) protein